MKLFPVTKANDDPAVKELARLGISTSQAPATMKLKGKQSPLTATEKAQLAEAEGKILADKVSKWITTKEWAALDEDHGTAQGHYGVKAAASHSDEESGPGRSGKLPT